MANYDGCYDPYGQSCGISGGCGGGCSSCGGDYTTCSPDYSPVTVNNSTSPNVEGSTSAGGASYGNSSTVSVNMNGGGGYCNTPEQCCKEGAKKLLQLIYNQSLEEDITAKVFAYGNKLPTTNLFVTNDATQLLSLAEVALSNMSICNDTVRTSDGVVSLCAISLLTFVFTPADQNKIIKETFNLNGNCGCGYGGSCECGKSMAQALCYSGIGVNYNVTLQDVMTAGSDALTVLESIELVAFDANMAIFSQGTGDSTEYYGIPTCRIARFRRVA